MGIDVLGRAPNSPEGRYFGCNWQGWDPIADLIATLCPHETSPRRGWRCNDGDGLTADLAAALAAKLEALRDIGEIAAYLARCHARAATLPRDPCHRRGGTGVDNSPMGAALRRLANPATPRGAALRRSHDRRPMCDGAGVEPSEASGPDPDNIDQFITFLWASGGFAIT